MDEIKQGFFKGISRGQDRSEFGDPNFFYSLQNARLLQNGRIGEIVRINGYDKASTLLDSVDQIYDIINFGNNGIAFYKTTTPQDGNNNYEFGIAVFDSSGDEVNSFTYLNEMIPETGKLNQYDDTIFVAPHNKIVYNREGTFHLDDFISTIPKISDITTEDPEANKAVVEVTFNNTVSDLAGTASSGWIRVSRVNIPQGTEETVSVTVGANTTADAVLTSAMSRKKIAETLRDLINNDATISTGWQASLTLNELVTITSKNLGSSYNGTEIDVNTSTYTISDKDGGGGYGGDGDGYKEPVKEIWDTGKSISDNLYNASVTFATFNTVGGSDSQTFAGTVQAQLKGGYKSKQVTITGSDTPTNLATKIGGVLNNSDEITRRYDITTSTNKITISAVDYGAKFNTDFILSAVEGFDIPDDLYSVATTTEGTDARLDGTLQPNTPYWYTARFKYIDGHITQTCTPKLQFSDADNRYIIIDFDITDVEDLDGGLPTIQIYRKQEGENFFLIYEYDLDNAQTIAQDPDGIITVDGTTATFTDQGFSEKAGLQEQITTWTKFHGTQEVLENRLVKANVEFFDETYTVEDSDFSVSMTTDETNEDVAPIKSKVDVYVRPQYTDGTLGYFTEIDRVNVNDKNTKVEIEQRGLVESTDKTIKDLRFYGKYLPYTKEENLSFNTIEIQTPNLEGIAEPDLFPTQTKVFYGYKYISVWHTDTSPKHAYIFVKGWDEQEEDDGHLRYLGIVNDSTATINSGFKLLDDGRLQGDVHGTIKNYIPISRTTVQTATIPGIGTETDVTQTVYKLEEYEALKEAVSTGELFVRVSKSNVEGLSSTVSDDEILDTRVKVKGLDDTSLSSDRMKFYKWNVDAGIDTYMYPSDDSRIYLVLEDNVLDEIDNPEINRYSYRRRSNETNQRDEQQLEIGEFGTVSFEIINFQLESSATEDGGTGDFDFLNYREFVRDGETVLDLNFSEATYYLVNRNTQFEDSVIYLGNKDNEVSTVTLDTTGFQYKLRNVLTYSILAPYNIYDSLITFNDFNYDRTNFENQLIWSSPLINENYFAGGRNFSIENFYNVGSEYGKILDVVSLNGNLYVFCERGVARLLIGESLTQQAGGQVFVDSSQFITRSIWLLENLVDVKPESIVKKDGVIYFTDGSYVYSISGQGVSNISQGILELDPSVDYNITTVPKYDEIRIGDGSQMFVYNDKYQAWYGPFTYNAEKTIELSNTVLSYVDALVIEDTGNTFYNAATDQDDSYTTIIQSVGNDTQVGVIDKTYRKFYMSLEGQTVLIDPLGEAIPRVTDTTFKYGKDYNNMVSKQLDAEENNLPTVAVKNGWYHFGVAPEEGNTKKIYWDIETTNQDFVLSGFVTAYMLRRRR